jgi:hypothetical protein
MNLRGITWPTAQLLFMDCRMLKALGRKATPAVAEGEKIKSPGYIKEAAGRAEDMALIDNGLIALLGPILIIGAFLGS